MRSWFARTADYPSEGAQKTDGYFSRLSKAYEESGARYRVPLAVAILSVAFEQYPSWITSPVKVFFYDRLNLDLLGVGLLLCSLLTVPALTSRWAIALFIAIAMIVIVPDWLALANHSYLALWCIPVAVLFREWWKADLYALYLRMTLGVVMLGAFAQKILAGTYIDGSFVAFLSKHGGVTERMFAFMCSGEGTDPCASHQMISIFILVWQLVVGILLLLGLNSLVFLAIEIGFLLGAGIYADEMNFQILNIAVLCVIFRFGMPLWLLAVCVPLLFIDLYGVSDLVKIVLNYVA